jgi:hypothetical protein
MSRLQIESSFPQAGGWRVGHDRPRPGTGRRAALAAGASFSHHAQGGGIWPDGAGMPDPQPQARRPTNPAPEPSMLGSPDPMADFVGSTACPWRPCGMPPCPPSPGSKGRADRPARQQEGTGP